MNTSNDHNPKIPLIHSAGASRQPAVWPIVLLAPLVAFIAQPAAAAEPDAQPPYPEFRFKGKLRGAAAVNALGNRLGTAAAWYGLSRERFSELLQKDPSAWLDAQGRLFFVDDFKTPPEAGTGATTAGDTTPTAPSAASGSSLLLHSKPGSQRVIYLDFTGHTLSGTAWNSKLSLINAVPYDLDGNPASFNTTELSRIQSIWQRVAEDFAPFDVDVTTEEPPAEALTRTNATDPTYGTRVVITKNTWGECSNNCGGIAYVGVFASTTDYYKPALVFYNKLGSGNEKYVAEAVSHEAGHNLGLAHDGTASVGYYQGHGSGATGWAPIMGVGYYRELTQWSLGEYTGANNKQDDIAVIQSNGAPLRTDDIGNSTAQAVPLNGVANGSTQTADQWGLIERRTDADYFGFATGGGTVQFSITPATRGPNLDISATLLNAVGGVVAASNPVDGLGATFNTTLAAGNYFLKIDGVGKGTPTTGYSDYASLGWYHITGSYPKPLWAAPVAVAAASPTSGYAPLAVGFIGDGSTDADGTLVAYAWDFGDGTSATGANPLHTYTAPGRYTATLTVTDSQGLRDSSSVAITADPNPLANTMHVQDITVGVSRLSGGYYQCVATVDLRKYGGGAAGGAQVGGRWTGVAGTRSMTVTANANGIATFAGNRTRYTGTCTFAVTGATLNSFTYDPTQNLETSVSWTY
jgi:PKD repeat protein